MARIGDYINTPELARQLERAPETIKRWRRERSGPPYIRIRGRVVYDVAQVAEWMQAHTVKADT